MIEPITTHEDDALARMLMQYQESDRLRSLVSALVAQIQQVEDALNDVLDTRAVATATGTNLDELGAIVDFARPPGATDAIYRILILGKIGLNVSQGETERVIDVYRLLTQATEVRIEEYPVAALSLYSNGSLDPELVTIVAGFLEAVVAAGVSVEHFGLYDADEPFVFAGNASGLGFGDLDDLSVGGKLSQLLVP